MKSCVSVLLIATYSKSLFPPAFALDLTLRSVECNTSLPIYAEEISIECDFSERCSLGSEAILHGKLRYVGVEDVGLVDGYAFISADLVFRSLEFQMLQYLQAPICGQYVAKDEVVVEDDGNDDGDDDDDDEVNCPADGVYQYYIPYVLPNEESKATWLASGWEGVGYIQIFSEANNKNSLMGSCDLYFATAVTTPESNSIFAKVPVPSAMVSCLVMMAFAAILVIGCVYGLVRDIVMGKKKKKRKENSLLKECDDLPEGTHVKIFERVEQTTS